MKDTVYSVMIRSEKVAIECAIAALRAGRRAEDRACANEIEGALHTMPERAWLQAEGTLRLRRSDDAYGNMFPDRNQEDEWIELLSSLFELCLMKNLIQTLAGGFERDPDQRRLVPILCH